MCYRHHLSHSERQPNPEYRDSPYISLAQPERDLARLENADACISVEYDYPLRESVHLSYCNPGGFTRA
jgi:hypothetical protein